MSSSVRILYSFAIIMATVVIYAIQCSDYMMTKYATVNYIKV